MSKTKRGAGRPRRDPGVKWKPEAMRRRRVVAGLTIQGIATEMGVAYTTASRWEREPDDGGNSPTPEQIAQLARLMRCKRTGFSKVPRLT